MGKYDKFNANGSLHNRPYDIHPIWRGVGCVMMLIIPIMSYAGSVLLVEGNRTNNWLGIPMSRELMRTINLPVLGAQPHLLMNLMVTLLLSLVGFAALMIIYAVLARVAGPPHLSPLDAEPIKRAPKPNKYTRKTR